MNRILAGTMLTIALAASASAATPSHVTASTPAPDYSAQCKTLGEQWTTASASASSNKHFAAAKADAAKAGTNCKSTKTASQKKGVSQYEAALKLIGATPTI
jgi:hypothetical protein